MEAAISRIKLGRTLLYVLSATVLLHLLIFYLVNPMLGLTPPVGTPVMNIAVLLAFLLVLPSMRGALLPRLALAFLLVVISINEVTRAMGILAAGRSSIWVYWPAGLGILLRLTLMYFLLLDERVKAYFDYLRGPVNSQREKDVDRREEEIAEDDELGMYEDDAHT